MGTSPMRSHRTVRETLASYGSCQSNRREYTPFPMYEKFRICASHTSKPLKRASISSTKSFILSHNPDHQLVSQMTVQIVQGRLVEGAIVRNPPSQNGITEFRYFFQSQIGPIRYFPVPHRLSGRFCGIPTNRRKKSGK